jgi:SAM-dependent MidA family methyltransferase
VLDRIRRPRGLWTPAAQRVAREVQQHGRITFARFMELALFDPAVGYYVRPTAGPGVHGDYVTSPELHAAFGGLCCLQIAEMWQALGSPSPFWLVEAGPGRGTWMADVLRMADEVRPALARALRVVLVEPSATLRQFQRNQLARWANRIRWISSLDQVDRLPGPGALFANEVLDALPFHRVIMAADGLQERYVDVHDGSLVEVDAEPSTPALAAQLRAGSAKLSVGQEAEISLVAAEWVDRATQVLDTGFLLLIDYGAPADQLYGNAHPRGTLRCFDRHTLGGDPLSNVGEQDITADVDFSSVSRVAARAGWELAGATSQRFFLTRLGLPSLVKWIENRPFTRSDRRAQEVALDLLVDPDALGDLLVVALQKASGGAELTGFGAGRSEMLPMAESWWSPRTLDSLGLLRSGAKTPRHP